MLLVPGCFILRTSLLLLYSFYYTPFFTKMQVGKFLTFLDFCFYGLYNININSRFPQHCCVHNRYILLKGVVQYVNEQNRPFSTQGGNCFVIPRCNRRIVMNNLTLKKIDQTNFIDAFHLELQDGQEKFVSHPIRSLAQAYD